MKKQNEIFKITFEPLYILRPTKKPTKRKSKKKK